MNWRSSGNERGRNLEMNGRTRVLSRALSLLVTLMVMAGAEELVAQRRGGGAGQRAQMERRLQARFDDMVREELELSGDQVQGLQDVVDAFRIRRLEFSQDERNSRLRVGRLGRGGGAGDLTEQEATEILAEMLELSDGEATLFREEQEAFLQILSPLQVVRFIVMRQSLGDRILGLRGGAGRGGAGRGRGPQGPQGGGRPGRLRP